MATNTDTRLTGPGVAFQSFDSGQRVAEASLAGKFGIVLTALIGAILFVGALVVISAVFLVAVLAALFAVAIRGAWQALAPRSRKHHVDGGGFRPTAVIETTAKAIRTAAPKPRP
jgi:predicted phage tail protein